MLDDTDLAHLESLIDQSRSKLAKTAGYLPDVLSNALQDLLDHIDEFHDEVVDEAEEEEDEAA
jgi:hypothetical protein